jgi:redox-sensitive bicupin YhaK (pirin superfamily)
MKFSIHKSSERFHTKIDWLDAYHYFSFGGHYDKNRISFGALLVVNDDIIAAHSGFDTHPHRDMEIITIPLTGTLTHKDSTGAYGQISPGEIQTMTAGTGVAHSEHNIGDIDVHSYQIWIVPSERGLTPNYSQKSIPLTSGTTTLLVSPDGRNGSQAIHQDAYISRALVQSSNPIEYTIEANPVYNTEHNLPVGVFIICVSGTIDVKGAGTLSAADWIEITNIEEAIHIATKEEQGEALIIQVPMLELSR